MSSRSHNEGGGGLSLQTLLLASVSAGVAALIVSRFWPGGAVASAAITPVIVTLVSETLRRPTERIGQAARPLAEAAARPLSGAARSPSGRRERGAARSSAERPPTSQAAPDVPRFGTEGPVPHVYGGRRVRLQVALLTAGIAFVIAVIALTLPELVLLDRSVGGGQDRTTFFGGRAPPREESGSEERRRTETDAQETTTTTTTTTTPTETAPTTTTEPGTPTPAEPQAPSGGEQAPPSNTAPTPAPGEK